MRKILFLLLLTTSFSLAQSVTDYTFTASSGTYTPLSGATTATLSGGGLDDGYYNAIPIGFTFNYMGNNYTTVSFSTNGWMTFGQNISSSAPSNSLQSGGTRPLVAPLWDDLKMSSGGVKYKTEGTAPNRVFTLEASNVYWNYYASGAVISFQIKLYESNMAVEFVYRQETYAVYSGSASIGITATGTGSGNFLSLNNTSSSPSVSSTTETSNINTKPATGQTYTFTPNSMTYSSSTTEQASISPVLVGSTNQPVIRLKVVTSGTLNPFNVTSITFTTSGTTNTADLTAAKVYYTTSPTFSTSNPFGSTINNPSGTLTFTGSQQLAAGNNYFWLAYDISSSATVNNVIDGTCTQFVTSESGGPTRTPDVTDPAGSRTIKAPLSGNVNVGTGQEYTSLTKSDGLFEAINLLGLSGNLNVFITSDLSEDGTNALNQWTEYGGSGYTLTIQPSSATVKTISGNYSGGLIRLNGADRVIIDGKVSGSGKYLRLRNTNSTGPTITLINDASNDTIRDCYIEGATTSTSNGVVFFSNGATTGNDNNMIRDCIIRDRSDSAGVPANLVFSQGSSSTIRNSNNTILNCQIFNFTSDGISLSSTNDANEGWTITGNDISQNATATSTVTGIRLNSYGNNLVSQNLIHDLNTSVTVNGIYVDNITNVTIERNKIYNIPSTSGSTGTLYGIYVYGFSGNCRARIYNNQISIVPSYSNAQTVYGIREWADTGDSTYLFYNSVFVGGTGSGTSKSYAYDDNSGTTHNVVYNNAFVNVRTGGTGGHFAARHASTGSITSTLTDNNFYVGNGPSAGNNFELSSTASSFTSWKAAYTGAKKDNYSYSINSADLTVSNLFTNAPSGDLSVINTNQECWLLNGKGQPISTVNNDYANNSRSTSVANGSTDIGAFEFSTSTTPPAATPSGTPAPSTTTTYSVSFNTVTSIAWGGSGTVPTSVYVQYYSGTPAPYSGTKPRINAYWNITQTGGSGFTYDITLTYDEAQLGSINENNLVPAKSDDGGTTWTPYTTIGTGPGQFQRNTAANTITLYGMTSFSYFTLGDEGDPLPVQLSSFTASTKGRDVILTWTTATEVNTAGFEIERKLVSQEKAQAKWENVGFVRGNGNSNRPVEYTFTDTKLNTGKYAYRLKMVDNDGSYEYSNEVVVEIGKPDVTKIEQNYPNAFNPATKIEYQLANPSKVVIEVYNITGQKITELVNDEQVEGYYSLVFDASKYGLASGIYFYRMIAMDKVTGKNVVQTKKMLYLK
jgi:hypothetical protein